MTRLSDAVPAELLSVYQAARALQRVRRRSPLNDRAISRARDALDGLTQAALDDGHSRWLVDAVVAEATIRR